MAKALFSMPPDERSKIQEKIPLKILKRLKDVYEAEEHSNGNRMVHSSENLHPLHSFGPEKNAESLFSSQAVLKSDI